MNEIWRKVMLGLLLALPTVSAAKAENIVLWDRAIAAAVRAQVEHDACGPYDLYRPNCGPQRRQLDQDDDGQRLTTLDHVALFVYRYKDLNLKAQPQPGTQLKFTTALLSLYEQEVKVGLQLRMRF